MGTHMPIGEAVVYVECDNCGYVTDAMDLTALVTSEAAAPVTVSTDAIQQVDNKPVVYLKVPGGFLPQPVELGRSDGKRVEVLSGLKPGAAHAAAGSFVVKSEAGKASATHTH